MTSSHASLDDPGNISKFQNLEISILETTDVGSLPLSSLFLNHNLEVCHPNTMASDCHLPSDISNQTRCIQEQLQLNDDKMNQAQENFKIEVHHELDEFRALLAHQQQGSSVPFSSIPAPSPVISTTGSTVGPSSMNQSSAISGYSISPPVDLQSQMMLLLTESFSKLSTTLSENKSDSKVEWHEFSGDSKKFWAWYLGLMAHLSLPPWTELYDPVQNDVVLTTTNSSLNGKLYSKVLRLWMVPRTNTLLPGNILGLMALNYYKN